MPFRNYAPFATLLPFNMVVETIRILQEKDDSKKEGPNNYRPSQTPYQRMRYERSIEYEHISIKSASGR